MLILTRKVGETIVIGHDIKVTVLGVKNNQVRIGIDAPKEITVHREEIFERIQSELSRSSKQKKEEDVYDNDSDDGDEK